MADPTSEIIVAFSGGKDSLAALDVCARRFDRIEVYWMYWVRGLAFQENVLHCIEKRYGLKILRVPHFALPSVMSSQTLTWYRPSYPEFRDVKPREMDDYIRAQFDLQWIASGEKKCDSMDRRVMMMASGQWDEKRLHFYPLMEWSHKQVWLT